MKLTTIPVPNKKCFYAENIHTWKPAHTTTYILPIYEIEMTVDKLKILKEKVESSTDEVKAETANRLQKQIDNWVFMEQFKTGLNQSCLF